MQVMLSACNKKQECQDCQLSQTDRRSTGADRVPPPVAL